MPIRTCALRRQLWSALALVLFAGCRSLRADICSAQLASLVRNALSCVDDPSGARTDECDKVRNAYALVTQEPNATDEQLVERILQPSSPCELPPDLRADFDRVSRFLRSIALHVGRAHALASDPEPRASVVVVGAGPVGLISAVQAHASGARVTVIEKRQNFTRDIWFDLLPAKFQGVGVQTLEAWGFFELGLPFVREVQHGTGIVTVQCHVLQRFLALVLSLSGVGLQYSSALIDVCDADASASGCAARPAVRCAGGRGYAVVSRKGLDGAGPPVLAGDKLDPDFLCFDLLLACDGKRSAVRRRMRVPFDLMSSFETADRRLRYHHVAALSQVTLILAFDLTGAGKCPRLRTDPEGRDLSPFAPAFAIRGVTSVFKRFFEPYCEMQVLFNAAFGASVFARYASHGSAEDALPWAKLLEITNFLLDEPLASEDELRAKLRVRPGGAWRRASALLDDGVGGRPPAALDVAMFNITISRAAEVARFVGDSAVLFLGDALVTAHYRLGVGVNRAFALLPALGRLVASWQKGRRIQMEAFDAWNLSATAHVDWMVNRQVGAMFFEAHCNCAVYQDEVFLVERRSQTLEEVSASQLSQLPCLRLGSRLGQSKPTISPTQAP